MATEHVPISIASSIRHHLQKHRLVSVIGGLSKAAISNLVLQAFESLQTQLIICSDSNEAEAIAAELRFFSASLHFEILESYDVSPYSTLYPKPGLSARRMQWLARATDTTQPAILIAPLTALLQRTLPIEILKRHDYRLKVGETIDEDFFELLQLAGYHQVDTVEQVGEYAKRGGIIDIFSTAQSMPVRVELFGDDIESLREFDVETQISSKNLERFRILPAHELLYSETDIAELIGRLLKSNEEREVDGEELEVTLRSIQQEQRFPGMEFLLPYFYENLDTPLKALPQELQIWWVDQLECQRTADIYLEDLKVESGEDSSAVIRPQISDLFETSPDLKLDAPQVVFQKIQMSDEKEENLISWSVTPLNELKLLKASTPKNWSSEVAEILRKWGADHRIFVGARNETQVERIKFLFEKSGLPLRIVEEEDRWSDLMEAKESVFVVPRALSESTRLVDDRLIFLREEDLLGRKVGKAVVKSQERFQKEAEKLSFGDLKSGDYVVHSDHGIGIYEGLKVMTINNIDGEYLQVRYKDNDRLYLPVYKLNHLRKYSGGATQHSIDKLGGTSFEKTKIKVKAKLRDIANELLDLYARRAQIKRNPYPQDEDDYRLFESSFPYDETDDQLRAIGEIHVDLNSDKPMDRLVCGDVGFGKTEVAMRAAFRVAHSGKQVAVLAPTTVLTFQHFETFQKRFKSWPFRIRAINRFVSKKDQRQILEELANGEVDIIIGTHRLLSQDVTFQNLGLLVLDEEQKFGVTHKEKIRRFKTEVDTLAMSATPIPRTLNLSFVGVRDMSMITTPPMDRIPTRTFVCKFEEETIRKAILAEVQRGGQIYFIHNRVQSIYGLADELRQIVPEVRLRVGHGQMKEHELEKTMTDFFRHEFDMLVCTTIVESGMDVPLANTMFIDQAQNFGLSQLYQLRGRVGRSKQRAYCYLLVPRDRKKIDKEAQERLRVIQENTALGSGIRVAHYDLELRGAGDILGHDQAGHINAVGYELYMELLEQTIHELKGEPDKLKNMEPEVDLKIPALIPDKYIQDIRSRLYYYKAFNDIDSSEDVDKYEDELRDQFGKLPEPVVNLLGVMLIKSQCRTLGIQELKAGPRFISLKMIEQTPLPTQRLIELATMENKKYSITPDSRLKVRMNEIAWPRVYEELEYLVSQCPSLG